MYVRKLRTLNQIVGKHIEQFGTREDFKILLEIAEYQESDSRLTLKQLVLSAEIPESTLKRRLARTAGVHALHRLGKLHLIAQQNDVASTGTSSNQAG